MATTVHLLEEMRIGHYKRVRSNCKFDYDGIPKSSASLRMCAFKCTNTSTCKRFVRRHGECGLTGSCALCCSPPTNPDDGWSFYCPSSYGKMPLDTCS